MVDKLSAPAFTMGNPRHKITFSNELAPGPGAYDSLSYIQGSKQGNSAAPKSNRFKQYGTFVPGPGTYSSMDKSQGPNALVMSRSRQFQPSSTKAPGPGSYQPNYQKLVKNEGGFTIGSSSKIGDIVGQARKNPGPGNYQTNRSTVTKDHGPKIGSQKRIDMVLNHFTPGPGEYQSRRIEELTGRKEPNAVFGKSGRSFSTTNIVPGPGTYANTETDFNRSKGFSLSAKHNQIPAFTTKVPGPGAYATLEQDLLKKKGASWSIGKGPKLVMEHQKEVATKPGPERYNITHGAFQSKATVIGRSQRKSLADERNIPGPGSYNHQSQLTLPKFSIPRSNSTWLKTSQNPGPGAYESKMSNSQYNSIKMKQDQRRPYYNEKKGIPGPGSYNQKSTLQQSIKFSIGNQKRSDIAKSPSNLHPGPGNYNIPSTVSNIPKYSH